jgi:four helix bundle protein
MEKTGSGERSESRKNGPRRGNWRPSFHGPGPCCRMHRYKSLVAWQRSHELVLLVLRTTDATYHPRSRALFDQLRRAALSIEANIVEGYALSTTPQFRRHLRIAIGSAAETECFLRTAGELDYLPRQLLEEMLRLTDGVLRALFGLVRKLGEPTR